jgi:hypothetical protein
VLPAARRLYAEVKRMLVPPVQPPAGAVADDEGPRRDSA